MECLNPVYVPRKAGHNTHYSVPCGKCMGCLHQKRLDWAFRIGNEMRYSSSAIFITLTYSDENMTLGEGTSGTLLKKDIQDFMKRLRQDIYRQYSIKNHLPKNYTYTDYEKQLKYFIAGEYGTLTFRPHYHGILFNIPTCIDQKEAILKNWGLGYVHVGQATPKSISYTAKYCISEIVNFLGKEKNFMLVSKGMGKEYISRMKSYHNKNNIFFWYQDQWNEGSHAKVLQRQNI